MFCKNKKSYSQKLKGFLIAEVLIASFVLTVGLTATMALIANSLKNSFDTRDAIIAVELAQEGVELVRNVRDNNFAAGGNGFAAFSNSKKHCRIDYNDIFAYPDALTVNPSLECTPARGAAEQYTLQYSSSSGFYRHNNTLNERFSRYIFIDYSSPGGPGNEMAPVRSFVYWGGAGDFSPSGIHNNGDNIGAITATCTPIRKCVFTEVTLTNWK